MLAFSTVAALAGVAACLVWQAWVEVRRLRQRQLRRRVAFLLWRTALDDGPCVPRRTDDEAKDD